MHPKVSFDGTKLVCIANYLGSLDLFISSLDSGNWGTPESIFPYEFSSKYDFRYPQLNFDNTKIYFSAKEKAEDNFDIYYSTYANGIWSNPIEVPMNINTDVDELAPAISADEKKLMFTRPLPTEAKADESCQDIYLTEITETGEWSEATPLPPSYNTGCVCSPYFTRDNKSFFFSSNEDVADSFGRRISKNQFNLFWAKIDGFFEFKPKPLSSLIGENDLVSFSLDANNIIYYGSGNIFDKNQENVNSEVQSASLEAALVPEEMTLLAGYVLDENSNPLTSSVEVINPFTTKIFQSVSTDKNGYYQVFVTTGDQFSILASTPGYSVQSKLIETSGKDFKTDFSLFSEVNMTFNVFDEDFYFPIVANLELYDSSFNLVRSIDLTSNEQTSLSLGRELNIIFTSDNYFPDTLNIPFDQEVTFDFFDFDIDLKRAVEKVTLSFNDKETGDGVDLELTVFNVTRNEKTKRSVKEGSIVLELRDGELYEISTSAQDYSYYTEELHFKEGPKELVVELQSVVNTSIVLDHITFEHDSYALNATSYQELDKLVTYLAENELFFVEIAAFTDSSGPADYNLKLSNLRANAVLQYLQDKSITRERLLAKGYGETQPKYPNDTDENMAKNRRVEFKIVNAD